MNTTKFDHLMADIETLATHTSNASILSIGFLPFSLTPEGPAFGKPYLVLPNFLQQIAMGRMIDPKTQKFWLDQTSEARAHWADPEYGSRDGEPAPYKISIQMLPALLKDIWDNVNPTGNLWANGSVFDIANLENLCNMEVPWPYNAARDLRTMCRPPYMKLRDRFGDENSNYHDPITDCINQCWQLWEYWPFPPERQAAQQTVVRSPEILSPSVEQLPMNFTDVDDELA